MAPPGASHTCESEQHSWHVRRLIGRGSSGQPSRDGPQCLAAHLEFSEFGNKDLLMPSCQLNVSLTSLAKDPRLCSVPVSKMDLVFLTRAGKRHMGVAALLGTRGACGELCP